MDEDQRTKIMLGNAYRIFYSEMSKHLKRARELFENLEETSPVDRKNLSMTFHTVKGGAGFFSFNEIAEHAKKLEELFRQEDLGDAEFETARESLMRLESLYSELPQPATEMPRA